MQIKHMAKIKGTQDGAIWGKYLFRFSSRGECFVYDLNDIECSKGDECPCVGTFSLDRSEEVNPHSNSVMFGKEYYSPGDEFPLLYTNIYNNYTGKETPLKGVTLVYRLQKEAEKFITTLVQIIEIGFVEDSRYWKSEQSEDKRPFGNFAIDVQNGLYYAFTMRDASKTTRYFSFDLPHVQDGEMDGKYHVKKVVLNISDIKEYFDCEYHYFVQGASCHKEKIYSLEGFTCSNEAPPAMRIIDLNTKKQVEYIDFMKMGYDIEPEMIDFAGDVCYYGDSKGNLYIIEF